MAMGKVAEKIKEEFLAVIPPTIFFFVALHLVAYVRSLMVKGTGLPLSSSLSVTIAALVLGKSVLIADLLPAVNRFPEKPLAYNVIWKTVIYVLVSGVVHYLEHLVDYWRKAGGFIAGNELLFRELVWPHFWAIQIVLIVIIFDYVTIRELVRVIGADTMKRMFFGPMPARPAPAR
jgi:hypothetical protein